MKRAALMFLFVLLAIQASAEPRVTNLPKVGEMMPDFAGSNVNGREVRLSDYRGRVVLVDFWATWCGPCMAEMPSLRKLHASVNSRGFDILGISSDRNPQALREYLLGEKTALPWQVIYDGPGAQPDLSKHFGIASIPQTCLVDRDGKVLAVDLRGEALEMTVLAAMDPTRTFPPSVILPVYLTAEEKEAKTMTQLVRNSLQGQSHRELAGLFSQVGLGQMAFAPSRSAVLADAIPEVTVVDGASFSAMDIRATFLHAAGRAKEAAALEERVLLALDDLAKQEGDAAAQAAARNSAAYAMPLAKLALFHAASGDLARARGYADRVDAISEPQTKAFMQNFPFYVEAQKQIVANAPRNPS